MAVAQEPPPGAGHRRPSPPQQSPISVGSSPRPFRRPIPELSGDSGAAESGDASVAAPVIDRSGSAGARGGSGGRQRGRRNRPSGGGGSDAVSPPLPSAAPSSRPRRMPTPPTESVQSPGSDILWSPPAGEPDQLRLLVRSERDDRVEVEEEAAGAWRLVLRDAQIGVRIAAHVARNPRQNRPDSGSKGDALSTRFKKTPRVLGRGAFATVYEGHDEDTGRFIAIKEIQFLSDSDEVEVKIQRIAQEVRMMKRLQHPHIVRYLGAGRDKNILRIYTEYVSGGSLTSLLRSRDRGFPEKTVRVYTRQIVDGLVYLHSQGIAHRDIKGDNVLLEKNSGVVKLSDFNSSKELVQVSLDHGAGTLVGTPWFMAPEIIRNLPYGLPADVWSIGCTVIEMLTAAPPWSMEFADPADPQVAFAAMYRIAQTELQPRLPEGLSIECENFILRECMLRDPRERLKAAELLQSPFIALGSDVPPQSARSGRSSVGESPVLSPGLPPCVDELASDVLPGRGGRVGGGGRGPLSSRLDMVPLSGVTATPPGSSGSRQRGQDRMPSPAAAEYARAGSMPQRGTRFRPDSGSSVGSASRVVPYSQTLPPGMSRPPSGGFAGEMARQTGSHADAVLLEDIERFHKARIENAFDSTSAARSPVQGDVDEQLALEKYRKGVYRGGKFAFDAHQASRRQSGEPDTADTASPLRCVSLS
eukprot:TRINITY_DN4284_c0_g2_i1.p1 TRINITY_DN4284_c0_g2~~TRINITY_DN4284_c0_g2_i1.p1  ORF type:complete len:700 (+),score=234.42 TRINITY_DN4284_c0_g2_i1:50-2149(+)